MMEHHEPLPSANDELWSLVEALLAGTATPEERDRLEAHLRADPQARLFYVTYLDVHAHLQWSTRGDAAPPVVRSQPSAFRWLWRPAVAASFFLAVGLLGRLTRATTCMLCLAISACFAGSPAAGGCSPGAGAAAEPPDSRKLAARSNLSASSGNRNSRAGCRFLGGRT